jgi:hypothetical protein
MALTTSPIPAILESFSDSPWDYPNRDFRSRLKNATANTVLLFGTSEYSNNAAGPLVQSRSEIVGQFTLAVTSTIQVQHSTLTAKADNGLGLASAATWTDGNPVEVKTIAEFWKIR